MKKKIYKLSQYHLDIFYMVKLIRLYVRSHYLSRPFKKRITNENMHWYILSRLGWVNTSQKNNSIYLQLNKKGRILVQHFIPKYVLILDQSVVYNIIIGAIFGALDICLLSSWMLVIPLVLFISYIYILFLAYVHELPSIAATISLPKYLKVFNPKLHKQYGAKAIIESCKPLFVKYTTR